MTQIEKAEAWFKANDYEVGIVNDEMCIQVWNNALEDSITVFLDAEEVEYRAELWDKQQEQSNQIKLC